MRPRYQEGSIQKRGSQWVLKFYENRDGGKRVRVVRPLAPWRDHPYRPPLTATEERLLREKLSDRISELLSPVNEGRVSQDVALSLVDFIEKSYFPRLDWRLQQPSGNEFHIEPSTIKGYKDIFRKHVKDKPEAKLTMQQFDARTAQTFLEKLPQTLSHNTHLRIKNFLSGVFTWALADGALSGTNSIENCKVGGQRKKNTPTDPRQLKIKTSNEHAYTLDEVAEMLDKLPDPARTVCAVAAFTGLTHSELPVLKWADYDGETIQVQRKIWKGIIGPTKTEARETGIFVIPLLRKILAKYKKSFPPMDDAGWIFRGEKLGNPLDLDNLSRRDIPQFINGAWFGWHAFRRGLGTRLHEAGVKSEDIQSILRHADISTTQAYYILPDQKRAASHLKKLDKVLRGKYGIKA
jgi:integrase